MMVNDEQRHSGTARPRGDSVDVDGRLAGISINSAGISGTASHGKSPEPQSHELES